MFLEKPQHVIKTRLLFAPSFYLRYYENKFGDDWPVSSAGHAAILYFVVFEEVIVCIPTVKIIVCYHIQSVSGRASYLTRLQQTQVLEGFLIFMEGHLICLRMVHCPSVRNVEREIIEMRQSEPEMP